MIADTFAAGERGHAMSRIVRITFVALMTLMVPSVTLPTTVLAADDDKNVVYEKKTVVDFNDDTIEGDLTKPDGDVFDGRKRAKHNRMIRIRPHFRSEVLQSIRSL